MRVRLAIGLGLGFLSAAALLPSTAQAAALEFLGKGVQVYECTAPAAGGSPAWHLKGPDAVLLDATGQEAGKHFAGPSWQAKDGSTVVGKVLVASPAPRSGAVPWLVLEVVSHHGSGRFAAVTYVSRTDTNGGAAPATGCDAAHLNAQTWVPYNAIYTLFAP